jgi:carbon-monoxide dehydrogenase iron sulfur subunit
MRGIIFVNVEKCLACRSCELQCAVEHSKSKTLFKAIREEPLPKPRAQVKGVGNLSLPLQCRHCEDAPCVTICPTGALEKQGIEQPVIIKTELCIGCKWCILVCPFGEIWLDSQGKAVIKCDMCIERLKKDRKPACVEACPTRALQFKPIEEVVSQRREKFLVELREAHNKGLKNE